MAGQSSITRHKEVARASRRRRKSEKTASLLSCCDAVSARGGWQALRLDRRPARTSKSQATATRGLDARTVYERAKPFDDSLRICFQTRTHAPLGSTLLKRFTRRQRAVVHFTLAKHTHTRRVYSSEKEQQTRDDKVRPSATVGEASNRSPTRDVKRWRYS